MTAPLSADLRRRLVRAVEAGSTAREAARRFEVSPSAAIKLMQRVRETDSAAPARIGGYRKPLLAGHEVLSRELTTAKAGITLAELRAELTERGIEAGSLTTIWATLRRLGLRHKKTYGPPHLQADFHDPACSVYANVSGLEASPRPRWRSARPGPHKHDGVERHFFCQVSRTPFDCQAISFPPPADPRQPPAPGERE
jgi:putative transposase